MRPWRALAALAGVAVAALLAGCVAVELGGEAAAQAQLALHDPGGAAIERRAAPITDALLLQPQPGPAQGDTVAIAFSPREHEYAFYQLAAWAERPARQLPRLLQRRLEARGVAGAVGLLGDPMQSRWLLAVRVDALYHDLRSPPGQARLTLTLDLYDRPQRARLAQRRIEAVAPVASADSAAAVQAMSVALGHAFDTLVPWLEAELERAAAASR
jgi:ABC-type uncharacterized transport system auxiliary subunit